MQFSQMRTLLLSRALNPSHVFLFAVQMITPGTVQTQGLWEPGDLSIMYMLMSEDSAPTMQLACLHMLASTIWHAENKELLLQNQQIIISIRVCAASHNPFVYSASTFLLFSAGLAIPSFQKEKYRANKFGADNVCKWTIDEVCYFCKAS